MDRDLLLELLDVLTDIKELFETAANGGETPADNT